MMTTLTLSAQEEAALQTIAQQTGKTEYDLVHEAVVQFIAQFQIAHRRQLLQQAQGMWQGRTDLPDLAALRQEFDRQEQPG
jgi:predicted transcriptional regulator